MADKKKWDGTMVGGKARKVPKSKYGNGKASGSGFVGDDESTRVWDGSGVNMKDAITRSKNLKNPNHVWADGKPGNEPKKKRPLPKSKPQPAAPPATAPVDPLTQYMNALSGQTTTSGTALPGMLGGSGIKLQDLADAYIAAQNRPLFGENRRLGQQYKGDIRQNTGIHETYLRDMADTLKSQTALTDADIARATPAANAMRDALNQAEATGAKAIGTPGYVSSVDMSTVGAMPRAEVSGTLAEALAGGALRSSADSHFASRAANAEASHRSEFSRSALAKKMQGQQENWDSIVANRQQAPILKEKFSQERIANQNAQIEALSKAQAAQAMTDYRNKELGLRAATAAQTSYDKGLDRRLQKELAKAKTLLEGQPKWMEALDSALFVGDNTTYSYGTDPNDPDGGSIKIGESSERIRTIDPDPAERGLDLGQIAQVLQGRSGAPASVVMAYVRAQYPEEWGMMEQQGYRMTPNLVLTAPKAARTKAKAGKVARKAGKQANPFRG